MRTHDTHGEEVVDRAAGTGNPETAPLTGPVPASPAPNVRVAPAASRARAAATAVPAAVVPAAVVPAASGIRDGGVAPGAGGAWCTDDVGDGGDVGDAGDTRDIARRPGRPRSERAELAIIDATIEALGERGIDGVRCEDVAARAGVGKATLYRRWAGKEDLLIAAFAAMKHPLPQPRGESVREDLIVLLTVVAADAGDPRSAQQYALLHGAGERYPRLVARYKEEIVEPRRDLIRAVLRRGVATGELRPDIDTEVAMLMLTGAVLARGKHEPAPAAPGFVDRAVDELLRGITPR
jgi:AcrR family transcriptional regulator